MHGCTVATGDPDTLFARRAFLDCSIPIGAGFYCEEHGGDGEGHEAAEASATAAPAALEPDDHDDGWSGEPLLPAGKPVLSGTAGNDRWTH